jgi:hypothetical protein
MAGLFFCFQSKWSAFNSPTANCPQMQQQRFFFEQMSEVRASDSCANYGKMTKQGPTTKQFELPPCRYTESLNSEL